MRTGEAADYELNFDLEQKYARHILQPLSGLTDTNAIRELQVKEGYNPCFGRDTPLFPTPSDPKLCSATGCYWIGPCNAYRTSSIEPLDKIFQDEYSLGRLQEYLARLKNYPVRLQSDFVGLKFSSFKKLNSATKKMLLISPRTVMGETSDEAMASLRGYILYHVPYGGIPSYGASSRPVNLDVLFTADPYELLKWLVSTQDFFSSGELSYRPLIKSIEYQEPIIKAHGVTPPNYATWRIPSSLDSLSFNAPHMGIPDGDLWVTDGKFAPLFNFELPVLENASFNALFKLMSDFPEQLCDFRNFLLTKIEAVRDSAIGSEGFTRDCKRIKREIADQIRKLQSDYKRSNLRTAVAASGCVVATFTLALYCVFHNHVNALMILGPSGVLYKITDIYIEKKLKQMEATDNPVYFLWVLGKTERAK